MLISRDLSKLDYVFPSQFPNQKKGEIDAIWKRIIFEGAGFDGVTGAVKEPFKAYLKNKLHSSGNFVKFCDQFWVEILGPQLKVAEGNVQTIERVFAMFQILSKEYIERDTCAMHDGFYWGDIQSLTELADCVVFVLRDFFVPWSLFTVPVALSRYRTARRCSVGMSRLANQWKTLSPDQGISIKRVFDKHMNEMKAAAAQVLRVNGVRQRDGEKSISEIKEIQTFRIASTIVRVAGVAASLFLYIMGVSALCGLFPFLMPLIVGEALPVLALILIVLYAAAPQGTLRDIVESLGILDIKVGTVALVFVLWMLIIELSPYNLITVSFLSGLVTVIGFIDVVFVIGCLFLGVCASVSFDSEQATKFYAKTEMNDSLAPVLNFLAKRISEVLDAVLYLVDGSEQAVE